MLKSLFAFITLTVVVQPAFAQNQNIGEWAAHVSLRTVNDIAVDNENNIWAVTEGGVLKHSEDGELTSFTTIEGLSRLDGTSIALDNETNKLFIGYRDGIIDVLDIQTLDVQRINDIERAENFPSKGINDLLMDGRFIYVATEFGIVVFDIDQLLVTDSFIQLGDFTRGIPVHDLVIVGDTLYSGTQEGIAMGNLSTDLALRSNWQNYDGSNGFEDTEVLAISFFNRKLYASTNTANYIFDGANWEVNQVFDNDIIIDYEFNENEFLIALDDRAVYVTEDGNNFVKVSMGGEIVQKVTINKSDIFIGALNEGIGVLSFPEMNLVYYTPDGPYQNFFSSLNFDNGVLYAASSQSSSGRPELDNGKGYYIFDGEDWQSFNQHTSEKLRSFGFRQAFTSYHSQEYYYFGSWGRGVARHHKESGEIKIFDETNSILRGWSDDNPFYPVISGLGADNNDDIWVVSRYGDTPLYVQTPGDEDWTALSKASSASNSDEYVGLFVDSYNQKWVTLQSDNTSGNGLLVIDTGDDPHDPADDRSVKLIENENAGNLPNEQVKAIIQDKNSEVWIGTERGIARFIFPEFMIDGTSDERRAQWLINEDTTAASRFLLRDVNINSIAVNSANEKWIGSTNQGIWVLNAEGSRIVKRFTMENSPIFSNNILSIAINEKTGEVYIATDRGLLSYQDIPKQPVTQMNKLKVFPNPFAYSRHNQIVIEGLSEQTQIKILGIDGVLVQEISATGGRIAWNGLDYNGNELGSGVYFVIAYEESGRENGMGKIVIIR